MTDRVPDLVLDRSINERTSLTFEEVRVSTRHSEILPSKTDTKTVFAGDVTLNIPFVSSPMDTVTEHAMAIAMAENGGIGVIHKGKGMDVESQAKEVDRVKFYLNGLIKTPITVMSDWTVQQVLNLKREKQYPFDTFAVIDSTGQLVGHMSASDFEFCHDHTVLVREAMTPFDQLVVTKQGTSQRDAFDLMTRAKKKVVYLFGDDRTSPQMYLYSNLKRLFAPGNHRQNIDKNDQLRVAVDIGAGDDAMDRASEAVRKHADVLYISTAHGDSKNVIDIAKLVVRTFPDIPLVVGNVSTGEGALNLARAGARSVLVGQGPGRICTTRVVAGIGKGQVSAVYEVARALQHSGVTVGADGGLKSSGDVALALCAGADYTVAGGLYAGTDESPGELQFDPLKNVMAKHYRGMGSVGAMLDSKAARDRYLVEEELADELVPEGVEGTVPYKGPLRKQLHQLNGGVRKCMGYLGCSTIRELHQYAQFWQQGQGGINEAHPSVTIVKPAPNYSGR